MVITTSAQTLCLTCMVLAITQYTRLQASKKREESEREREREKRERERETYTHTPGQ